MSFLPSRRATISFSAEKNSQHQSSSFFSPLLSPHPLPQNHPFSKYSPPTGAYKGRPLLSVRSKSCAAVVNICGGSCCGAAICGPLCGPAGGGGAPRPAESVIERFSIMRCVWGVGGLRCGIWTSGWPSRLGSWRRGRHVCVRVEFAGALVV